MSSSPGNRQACGSILSSGAKGEGLFRIGTFNVRGLTSNFKKNQLISDLNKYRVGLCCLQETKISEGYDGNIDNYRLLCLSSSCRHYGLGFVVESSYCTEYIDIGRCRTVSPCYSYGSPGERCAHL